MAIDKSLLAGSTGLLILRLLEEGDLYGYQMIERLRERSDDTFSLKAGTLYPLLHTLEVQGLVRSYERAADGARVRKYYRCLLYTSQRRSMLAYLQKKDINRYRALIAKLGIRK